jgi:hypothetical protein
MTSMQMLLDRKLDFEAVKKAVLEEYSSALGESFYPQPVAQFTQTDKH